MQTNQHGKADKLIQTLESWQAVTGKLEGVIVDNVSAAAPWLAPVVPAYLAYSNMTGVLSFPWYIALIAALVVEFLGLATTNTVFTLWEYNRTRKTTAPIAAIWPALSAAGAYIIVVIVVNVLLDLSNPVHVIAKALLSMLSILAAITLAIRAGHARRLAAIKQEREERRVARGKIPTSAGNFPGGPGNFPQQAGNLPGNFHRVDWRKLPKDERLAIAQMTPKDVQTRYGVSPKTSRNWVSRARAGDG